MENLFINITDKDIKSLVQTAQGAPEYLGFYKACFCVAGLIEIPVEKVIEISRPTVEALIEEANRIPQYATTRAPKGADIIF